MGLSHSITEGGGEYLRPAMGQADERLYAAASGALFGETLAASFKITASKTSAIGFGESIYALPEPVFEMVGAMSFGQVLDADVSDLSVPITVQIAQTVFYMMPQSALIIPTTGSATVSGDASELTGYEFNNLFDPAQPWEKWRSSYSDLYDHTITLYFTGAVTHLLILGANFTQIDRPFFSLDLVLDNDTDNYKVWKSIGVAVNKLTFTIPAQSTGDGYFEAHTMILTKPISYATQLSRARYPYTISSVSNSRENENESSRYTKVKRGEPIKSFMLELNPRTMTEVNTVNAAKRTVNQNAYLLYLDYMSGDWHPYIVRRAADFKVTQNGVNKYTVPIMFEEVC